MKAEELMIGDWVMNTHNQKPEHVYEIRERMVMLDYNDLYDYNEIEPIPITPEILEKNGFAHCEPQGYNLYVKDKNGAGLYNILWQGESYNYDLEIAAYTYPFGEFNKRNIKYVHQLQHALRLCGIEKEIIL